MIRTESTWDPSAGVLRTTLSGDVRPADVRAWEAGLRETLAVLPPGSRFKLLYDLQGFAPTDLAAHKLMREVIPGVLAAHGMRPVVADLFDPPPDVAVTVRNDVVCVAFANVHHDPAKMADYERRVGRATQRFFTDRAAAEQWLASLG